MVDVMTGDSKQPSHLAALEELTFYWHRKPLLHQIYHDDYRLIAQYLRRDIPGQIVEIGSGIGAMKSVIPDCVCTEAFPLPGIDRVANAYASDFADGSVSNLILFDVWHHLRFPGTALEEFHRVLAPGGRLILFEPAMSLLGLIVYGLFHHEQLGWLRPVEWQIPPHESKARAAEAYFSAQSHASRIFCSSKYDPLLRSWERITTRRMAAIAYVASGGFRGPQLYPDHWYSRIKRLTQPLDYLPTLFATRMLIVLGKRAGEEKRTD